MADKKKMPFPFKPKMGAGPNKGLKGPVGKTFPPKKKGK